ncbi:MAG: hypothetical protein ACM359_01095 [Bacillota bacterium]
MKTSLITLLAAGMLSFATGCATPGYSGGLPTVQFPEQKANGENANNVARAWHQDSRALVDDINSALLLDTPSRLTKWNLR